MIFPFPRRFRDPKNCDLKVSLFSRNFAIDVNNPDAYIAPGSIIVNDKGFLEDLRNTTLKSPTQIEYKFLLQPNHRDDKLDNVADNL